MLDSVSAAKDTLSYAPFLLAKADFLERSGNPGEAVTLITQAMGLTKNPSEKAFLCDKIERLEQIQ